MGLHDLLSGATERRSSISGFPILLPSKTDVSSELHHTNNIYAGSSQKLMSMLELTASARSPPIKADGQPHRRTSSATSFPSAVQRVWHSCHGALSVEISRQMSSVNPKADATWHQPPTCRSTSPKSWKRLLSAKAASSPPSHSPTLCTKFHMSFPSVVAKPSSA